MEFPKELRYTKEHEWLRVDGENGVIGITDYAQGQLGDIVFVEMPQVGRSLRSGEALGVVESVKTVSDIYSPVDGEVSGINEKLEANPEFLNQSAYEDGWILEIKIKDKAQPEGLLTAEEYQQYVEEEAGQ